MELLKACMLVLVQIQTAVKIITAGIHVTIHAIILASQAMVMALALPSAGNHSKTDY